MACLLKQARRQLKTTTSVGEVPNRTAVAAMHVKTKCATCGRQGVYTLESRITPSTGYRRRRKECCFCKARTTTYEVPEEFYKPAEQLYKVVLQMANRKPKRRRKPALKCIGCVHNDAKRERCGFDLPEHMTSDANDCLYFNQS